MVVNQTHQELLEKSRTKLGYDKDKQVGIIIIVITANFRQLSQCLRRTQHHIHHHHHRHHHRRRHRDHRKHHHPHRYHHQLSPAARSVGGGRHGGGGGRLLPGEELTFFTLLALNLQQLFFRDIKPTKIFHRSKLADVGEQHNSDALVCWREVFSLSCTDSKVAKFSPRWPPFSSF